MARFRLVRAAAVALLVSVVGLVPISVVARASVARSASVGLSPALSGSQTTLAFSGLKTPGPVAVDGTGDVFVADEGNNRVVELSPGGVQTTVGFSGLLTPYQVGVDAAGDVYVLDATGTIFELTYGGLQITLPFSYQPGESPAALAVDPGGDVFVATMKLVPVVTTGILELPFGSRGTQVDLSFPGPRGFPNGLAVDSAGDLFLTEQVADDVWELPTGGSSELLPFTGLYDPTGITVDAAGNVIVADTLNSRVVELSSGGVQTTLGFSGLSIPQGVASNGTGDVFVADTGNNRVLRFSRSTPTGCGVTGSSLLGVNVSPTNSIENAAVNSDHVLTVPFGDVTQSLDLSSYTASILFGDGASQSGAPVHLSDGSCAFQFDHVYVNTGHYNTLVAIKGPGVLGLGGFVVSVHPASTAPIPQVGVLTSATGPQCTATVIDSSTSTRNGSPIFPSGVANGDVIVTAAHCVAGNSDFLFAPGQVTPSPRFSSDYKNGKVSAGGTSPNHDQQIGATPYGVWSTEFSPIFDPAGAGNHASNDPVAPDYAFLIMDAPLPGFEPPGYTSRESLEQVVGHGLPADFSTTADNFPGTTVTSYDVDWVDTQQPTPSDQSDGCQSGVCFTPYPSDSLGPHTCSGNASTNVGGWLEFAQCTAKNYASGSPWQANGSVIAVEHGADNGVVPCCGAYGPRLDDGALTDFKIAEETPALPNGSVGLNGDPNGTANANSANSSGDTLQVIGNGVGAVTATWYASDPHAPLPGVSLFFDFSVSPTNQFSKVQVTECPPAPNPPPGPEPPQPNSTPFYWWNTSANSGAGAWQVVKPASQMIDVGTKCVTFTLNSSTTPSIAQLSGTAFGAPSLRLNLGSAKVWLGLKNSDDNGTRFDVQAEVLQVHQNTSTLVGSGTTLNVAPSGSGFAKALSKTFALALNGSPVVVSGDSFGIRVSVRIACGVGGHASGTARLFYQDGADSNFGTTFGGGPSQTFYLRSGNALASSAGTPIQTADALVTNKIACSGPGRPYTPIGIWTTTIT